MADIPAVTAETFDEFTKTGVALVDFTATWCGPCQVLKPTIAELATEYDGRVKVGAVDIDVSPEIASKFQVMGVPTLVFFKDGAPAEAVVGVQSKDKLKERLDALLAG